jgi:hypothetical protein
VKLWKVGLAGLSEVASSETILARDERARAQLSAEELHDRLRSRLGRDSPAPEASGGE